MTATRVKFIEDENSEVDPLSTGINELCSICGDRMTGKHYGANSCDGCKGFFRRSVRKNHHYICLSVRMCVIDKANRNQCRYCRLKKCFRAGMKKEAVQSERDKINTKRIQLEHCNLNVFNLIRAEIVSRLEEGRSSPETNKSTSLAGRHVASTQDVCEVMKEHLLKLIQWAKSITVFSELPLDDQAILLRGHATEHFILWLARNSLVQTDVILLGQNLVIPQSNSEDQEPQKKDQHQIAQRILDELVKPLSSSFITIAEMALLQGILFFDPYLRGLKDWKKVKSLQSQILLELEDRIAENQLVESQGRFGSFLLLLPVLQSIKQDLMEVVINAVIYGMIDLDSLVHEMILGGNSNSIGFEDIGKAETMFVCSSSNANGASPIQDSQSLPAVLIVPTAEPDEEARRSLPLEKTSKPKLE